MTYADFNAVPETSFATLNLIFYENSTNLDDAKNSIRKVYVAICDTGATQTVISQKVVVALSLQSVDELRISTANGIREASSYLVDVQLPNNITFRTLRVIDGNMADSVLIGIEIITRRDFVITSKLNRTCFSFQFPSAHHIDFVEEIKHKNLRNSNL